MAKLKTLQSEANSRTSGLPAVLCSSDPPQHTFVRGLINFSMTFQNKFSQRHILAYTCSDISWWLAYVQSWNGVQILEPPKPVLHIYSDASGSKGLGSIFEDQWFATRCPHCFHMRDIQFKVIYAVLQCILR